MGLEEDLKASSEEFQGFDNLEMIPMQNTFTRPMYKLARKAREYGVIETLRGVAIELAKVKTDHVRQEIRVRFIRALIAYNNFVDLTELRHTGVENLILDRSDLTLLVGRGSRYDLSNLNLGRIYGAKDRLSDLDKSFVFSEKIELEDILHVTDSLFVFESIRNVAGANQSAFITELVSPNNHGTDALLEGMKHVRNSYVYVNEGTLGLQEVRKSTIVCDGEKIEIQYAGGLDVRLVVLDGNVTLRQFHLEEEPTRQLGPGVYDIISNTTGGSDLTITQVIGPLQKNARMHGTYERSADELSEMIFGASDDTMKKIFASVFGKEKVRYQIVPTGHIFISGVVSYEEQGKEIIRNFRDLRQAWICTNPEKVNALAVIVDKLTEKINNEFKLVYFGQKGIFPLPTAKELIDVYR